MCSKLLQKYRNNVKASVCFDIIYIIDVICWYYLQFGEKGKIYLVRFLNSTVMVRVGGGWVTLQEFLQTNDPCRCKTLAITRYLTNFEIVTIPLEDHCAET